jgi:tankyrase
VQELLARGADPNAREVAPPPLPTIWERIRRLFHPPATDESSMAVLHRAVYNAKAEIVEDLLRHGADPNARWSGEFWYSNETPLNVIFGENCNRIVRALLDAGADPNAACIDEINHHPFPALYRALSYGDTGTVRLLLARGAKIDANPGIEWALEAAAFNSDPRPMKLLLEMGYDANAQPGGKSILSTAAGFGNLEVIKTIVDHRGLINIKDQKDGKTPLASAIETARVMNPGHPQGRRAREVAAYLRSIAGR